MTENRFEDALELRTHVEIAAIFKALEQPKLKVDMSLMDEMVSAVSVAKDMRAHADSMRLPSKYKTEEDLHKLAAFFAEAQSKRDRVVEVKLDHMPLKRSLGRFWDRAVATLYQYESFYKITPAPRRDSYLDMILEPLKDRISEVDMILEAASEADRHLGNVHFTLKELKAIGVTFIEGKRAQKGV